MRALLRFAILTFGFSLVLPLAAAAQRPYVGASLTGNTLRWSGVSGDMPGNGTSLGAGFRVGTAIGDRWGLDAEVVVPGWIESNYSYESTVGSFTGSLIGGGPAVLILQSNYVQKSRQNTLAASLWVRQRPFERVDLVYSAGLAFLRSDQRTSYTPPQFPGLPLPVEGFEREYSSYSAGGAMGLDVPVHVTNHLRVVPAMRLMIFGTALVARPSIGLSWNF
ncbi:MAG: outer membrane beta-barrel protein [Acidobacteria bacterium]|nr:outer membrane beta-barrel protein [Acidobacteriota bacterium]